MKMSGKESKSDAKVGGANTGNGSATPCSGRDGEGSGAMMAAPGQKGEYISREAFESNPKGYFTDLHAQGKPTSKPNK